MVCTIGRLAASAPGGVCPNWSRSSRRFAGIGRPLGAAGTGEWLLRVLAVLAVVASWQIAPASAQFELVRRITDDERSRLYEEIARDAEYFERQSRHIRAIVKLVTPTVVHINAVTANDRRTRQGVVEEAGSGVIIRIKGDSYVVTNRHVVRHAVPQRPRGEISNISIELADHRVVHPIRVLDDASTDIAIMQLARNLENLAFARLGNSDQVEVGDFVMAIGSPFALSHSVTFGHVSAIGRRDLELGENVPIQEFMQVDAAINPGNSGGPLINVRGEVIGVNTAIASSSGGSEGVGFAIPVNIVNNVVGQLIDHGELQPAFLGVTMERDFTDSRAAGLGLPYRQGVLVTQVTERSPAAASGLQSNDVILEYNGVRVDDDDHLLNLVRLTRVGTTVPVVVYRDGRMVLLKVLLGNAKDFVR